MLIDCFKRSQCFPRLVFLHMCDGGIAEKDISILQAFSGFAPKLIHARIPSVVAMQYPIKNPDAVLFGKAFYSALADGSSVDEAVQEGRTNLDLNRHSRLFGTPVLYMHSAVGLVLPKPSPASTQTLSSLPTESEANGTITQSAAAASSTPVRVNKADLETAVHAGVTAAHCISEEEARNELIKQLFNMKNDFKDTSRTDVFTKFLTFWEGATDPVVKTVWEAVLMKI